MIKKMTMLALTVCTLCATEAQAQIKLGGKTLNAQKLVQAGADMIKAVALSDADIAALSREAVEWMDNNNPVSPDTSAYSQRLKRLTENVKVDGLELNFKVYEVADVNAFACGDGSVRVFSSLMDLMDDRQLMGVIGHEIGHVVHADTKDANEERIHGLGRTQRGRLGRRYAGQTDRLATGRPRAGFLERAILPETGVGRRRLRIRFLRPERSGPLFGGGLGPRKTGPNCRKAPSRRDCKECSRRIPTARNAPSGCERGAGGALIRQQQQ